MKKRNLNFSVKANVLYTYHLTDTDDIRNKGAVKIGFTTCAISNEELDKYIQDGYPSYGEVYDKILEASLERFKQDSKNAHGDGIHSCEMIRVYLLSRYDEDGKLIEFSDHDIHNVIKKHGILPINLREYNLNSDAKEWYPSCITGEVLDKIFENYVKNGLNLNSVDTEIFSKIHSLIGYVNLREEQREAVNFLKQEFFVNGIPCCILDCKCRFGKTFTILSFIKENSDHFNVVKIITDRPETLFGNFQNDALRLNLPFKIFLQTKKENNEEFEERLMKSVENGEKVLILKSVQDIRGSKKVNGKFNKNDEFFNLNTDLLVVDEGDEGTKTQLASKVFDSLIQKNHTKVVFMSGTAFQIPHILFNLGFKEKDFSTYYWTYEMEQERYGNKINPRMKLFGIELKAFLKNLFCSANEFFRVQKEKFVHEKEVQEWIENFLQCGVWKKFGILPEVVARKYPFSLGFFHILLIVETVEQAKCLAKAIKSVWTKCFGVEEPAIVNIAGDGIDSTKGMKEVLKTAKNSKESITITCGRGCRAWTIPEWDAIAFLTGSDEGITSVASYLQSMFRVQSGNPDPNVRKDVCAVFDFAPSRLLNNVSSYISSQSNARIKSVKEIGESFIKNADLTLFNESGLAELKDYADIERELRKSMVSDFLNSGVANFSSWNLKLSINDFKNQENLEELFLDKFKKGKGNNSKKGKSAPDYTLYKNNQGASPEKEKEKDNSENPKESPNDVEKQKKDENIQFRKNVNEILRVLLRLVYMHGFEPRNFDELLDAITPQEWVGYVQDELDKRFNKEFLKEHWIEPCLKKIEGVFFDACTEKKKEKDEIVENWKMAVEQKNPNLFDWNRFYAFQKWFGNPSYDVILIG